MNKSLDCTSTIHISSTNYPENYENNENLEWEIVAPSQRRIKIDVLDFNLESKDHLTTIEPLDSRNGQSFTDASINQSFISLGNTYQVVFASDKSGLRKGFEFSIGCYNSDGKKRTGFAIFT